MDIERGIRVASFVCEFVRKGGEGKGRTLVWGLDRERRRELNLSWI